MRLSLRPHLVGPGEQHCQRQARDHGNRENLDHPVGRIHEVESKICRLQHDPAHEYVGDTDPNDISAL
jgi:hypothetical protein